MNQKINNSEHSQDNIIRLLSLPESQRSISDIQTIRQAFIHFKFFQDLETQMGIDMVNTLYGQLTHETAKQRQVIFNIGDIGRKFYIIIQGSVFVLIQKKGLSDGTMKNEEERKQEEKLRKESTRKATLKHKSILMKRSTKKSSNAFFTEQNQINVDEVYANMNDDEYLECHFPTQQKVGVMKTGDSFGEIALTKQMPRTATIVCQEETHFATISREQFNKLLSVYYEQLQQQNIHFLQNVPIFSEWDESMLNQLYYHFEFEDYKMFDIIYREGQQADKIYILKNGEIEISQNVDVGSHYIEQSLTIQKFFTKGSKIWERVRTAIITKGLLFGYEEILEDSLRTHKAVCLSQTAKVFSLPKDRFYQYLKRGNAIQQLILLNQTQHSRKFKSLNLIKEIKRVSPQLEQRIIPFYEEQDTTPDFVIKKPKNAVERVGSEPKHNGYEYLQGKGHINKAHYNFKKNFEAISRNIKQSQPLNINTCLFELDGNKGTAISIMNKVYPSATRPKYEIPSYSISPRTVIQSLKLPKLLNEVETLLSKDSLCSFTTTYKQSFKESE